MNQAHAKQTYTAALIVIGNEILSGRTQDTNTQWIAERLTKHGIVLGQVRVIPDIEAEIIDTVNAVREKYDYVFTTGGIGPTHDDITSECVAKAFGVKIEQNAKAYEILKEYYGIDDLTEARLKMAQIPVGATLIPNPVTAAPGFIMDNVHVMAGVPRIMQAMLDHTLENIEAGAPLLSHTVSCSLPESAVAQDLSEIQAAFPDLQMGSYPHYRGGVLGLSLVVRGTDKQDLEAAADRIIEMIKDHGDEPRALSIRSVDQ